MRPLRDLPKAHLHLHLTASMRPQTLAEMCGRDGIDVPAPSQHWRTFAEFAAAYAKTRSVMRTPYDLRRVVAEAIGDAARDGAVWVELQTSLSSSRICGSAEATIELILDTANDSARRHGIRCGLILSVDRGTEPTHAMRTARLAVRYRQYGVVGFGLGGDERYSEVPVAAAFHLAAEANLLCVPHAGEQAGAESVWRALETLGAHRVQHGIGAAADSALMEHLAAELVCLDVCPSSNVALGMVFSMREHPMRDLIAAGVRCSLNADGPLLFGTSLLSEYERCRRDMGFDDHQLARIARDSIEASAAPDGVKADALAGVDTWLSEGQSTA